MTHDSVPLALPAVQCMLCCAVGVIAPPHPLHAVFTPRRASGPPEPGAAVVCDLTGRQRHRRPREAGVGLRRLACERTRVARVCANGILRLTLRLPCSLISAVGIFCLGAGVSIVHGLHSMAHPVESFDRTWGFAVLILSTLVEGFTLAVAVRAVAAGARATGMKFLDFVKSGRDPVSVAIMAEDGAAVAGVIVAAACTALVDLTGAAVWDGIGSVLVGLILGGVAVYLIQRNRSFLIGRSMMEGDFQRIVRHLKRDPVIKNIYEAKSEEIGEGIYRCAPPPPCPTRTGVASTAVKCELIKQSCLDHSAVPLS